MRRFVAVHSWKRIDDDGRMDDVYCLTIADFLAVVVGFDVGQISVAPKGFLLGFDMAQPGAEGCPRLYSVAARRQKDGA